MTGIEMSHSDLLSKRNLIDSNKESYSLYMRNAIK